MSRTLHITNGDIAADLLRRSHVSGQILPWRDALHDGPVPENLLLADLSRRRADFITDAAWTNRPDVREEMEERDDRATAPDYDEIVLWFEHDLYDQLQMLQVIDTLAARPPERLSLVEVGEFPGIPKFVGLGQLNPSQMASLFDIRREVTPRVVALARSTWTAFRSPNPLSFADILESETFTLPFLQDAVLRQLEEYPSVENGLGRTEQQLLDAARDDRELRHLFYSSQGREERAFMGDSIIKWRLRLLADGNVPLLTGRARRLSFDIDDTLFWEQEVVLTAAGRAVLAGKDDAVRLRGIDRWFGGVHLMGRDVNWRWNRTLRRLEPAEQSSVG